VLESVRPPDMVVGGLRFYRDSYIYCYRTISFFSGITPANRNRLGRNFTQRRTVTWHAPLQTFGALSQTGAKWRGESGILRSFLSPKQRIVSPTSPADDFREMWTQNVNRCRHENFPNRISNFPERGHFP